MRLSMSTTSGRNHWNDLPPASPSATTRTIWMPWSVSRIVTLVLGPLETFAHGPPSEVARERLPRVGRRPARRDTR